MVCLDATNYCSVLDAVYYDNEVVGHIPYNLAPKVSAFLKRDDNKGFAEITGMNCGAGYGLEVPCVYRSGFYLEKKFGGEARFKGCVSSPRGWCGRGMCPLPRKARKLSPF